MSKSTSPSSGVGFGGLQAIVFITLKLLGKIDWSWWWVLSPLWGSVVLLILVFLVLLAVGYFKD